MSDPYKHIILVTDGLSSSDATNETAFNLAKKHSASVTVVDTVKPPTVAARWFSSNASDVFEMVVADKTERLEKIADRFRQVGIEATSKVLFGKSSEAITREAIESKADLVVRYMKGIRSKFPGLYGRTARELLRLCPTPLLLVGDKAINEPKVLAPIDADHANKENDSIIAEATRLSTANDDLFGLYCWEMYGADMIKTRMTDSAFKASMDHAESIYQQIFDDFVAKHDLSDFGDRMKFHHGDPTIVIPRECEQLTIDVVVMCTATLNHPFRKWMGSTVESVIDDLPCALLAVKPTGFVSPLAVADTDEVVSK